MQSFFDQPIPDSPYDRPGRHWELDEDGQPTDVIATTRTRSSLVSPIPKTKKSRGIAQAGLFASSSDALGLVQECDPTETINGIRSAVESWQTACAFNFDARASGQLAVKVINHLGDEVMKVVGV